MFLLAITNHLLHILSGCSFLRHNNRAIIRKQFWGLDSHLLFLLIRPDIFLFCLDMTHVGYSIPEFKMKTQRFSCKHDPYVMSLLRAVLIIQHNEQKPNSFQRAPVSVGEDLLASTEPLVKSEYGTRADIRKRSR